MTTKVDDSKTRLWKDFFETVWPEKSYQAQSAGSDNASIIDAIDYSAFRLLEFLEINEGDILAEIGAASGYLLSLIVSKSPCKKVYAVDYSGSLVRQGRQINPDFEWLQCSGLALKIPSNTCDKTFTNSVLHLLSCRQDAFQFVTEMIRITKPGGIVVLGDTIFNPRISYLSKNTNRLQKLKVLMRHLFITQGAEHIKYRIKKLLRLTGIKKYS